VAERKPIPKPKVKKRSKSCYGIKKTSKKKVPTPTPEGAKKCQGCGRTHGLSIHHIYGKSERDASSKHKCVEWLCWHCHQSSTGIHGTHSDGKLNSELKKKHQNRLESQGMARETFIKIFGRNYLV